MSAVNPAFEGSLTAVHVGTGLVDFLAYDSQSQSYDIQSIGQSAFMSGTHDQIFITVRQVGVS
jgi:hypothetical protein